jgi:DNA-binding transcriptional MerR regulator
VRIGELADVTGTTTKTLRFYESAGLLGPADRSPSGYRQFGNDAIGRLDFIRRGRAAGLSLAQIRQIIEIRDAGTAPCRHVRALLDSRLDALDRQIAELGALRETVTALRVAADTDTGTCRAEDVCRYL